MKRRLRWANPFYAEHYSIQTTKSPAECRDALRSTVASRYSPKTWLVAREEWPVSGAVTRNSFWLRRLHTFQRSFFLQEASGVINAHGDESLVEFRVGMSLTNATIQTTTLVLGLLACIVLMVAAPQSLAPWPAPTWLLWPAAAAALVVLDRLWWADDDVFLVEFIQRTVEGTRVDAARPARQVLPKDVLQTPS